MREDGNQRGGQKCRDWRYIQGLELAVLGHGVNAYVCVCVSVEQFSSSVLVSTLSRILKPGQRTILKINEFC